MSINNEKIQTYLCCMKSTVLVPNTGDNLAVWPLAFVSCTLVPLLCVSGYLLRLSSKQMSLSFGYLRSVI